MYLVRRTVAARAAISRGALAAGAAKAKRRLEDLTRAVAGSVTTEISDKVWVVHVRAGKEPKQSSETGFADSDFRCGVDIKRKSGLRGLSCVVAVVVRVTCFCRCMICNRLLQPFVCCCLNGELRPTIRIIRFMPSYRYCDCDTEITETYDR